MPEVAEKRSLFSSILGTGGGAEGAAGEGEGGESAGSAIPPEQKKAQEQREAYLRVQAEQAATIKKQAEQIEKLTQSAGVVDRLRETLAPDPALEAQRKELELRTRLDQDPLLVIREEVERRLAPAQEELQKTRAQLIAKDTMQALNKRYEIDWQKNANVVAAQLELLDVNFRRSRPEEALEMAVKLSGVAKARPNLIEGTDAVLDALEQRHQKRQADEATNYKAGLLKAKEADGEQVLRGLMAAVT